MKIYKTTRKIKSIMVFGASLVLVVLCFDIFCLHASFLSWKDWGVWVTMPLFSAGLYLLFSTTVIVTDKTIRLSYRSFYAMFSKEFMWAEIQRVYSRQYNSLTVDLYLISKDDKKMRIIISTFPDELLKEIISRIPQNAEVNLDQSQEQRLGISK